MLSKEELKKEIELYAEEVIKKELAKEKIDIDLLYTKLIDEDFMVQSELVVEIVSSLLGDPWDESKNKKLERILSIYN